MDKIFFDGLISSIKIQPYVDLEISESSDRDYCLIEDCDSEVVNISSISGELLIEFKKQPTMGQFLDAFVDLFAKKDAEPLKNLETPQLKIKVKVFTQNHNLRVKVNNGNIVINKKLPKLDLKANNLRQLSSEIIDDLNLKVNHGDVFLKLSSSLVFWDIKINKGDLNIKKNGVQCSFISRVNGERQQEGSEPKIDIRINSGILNFTDD